MALPPFKKDQILTHQRLNNLQDQIIDVLAAGRGIDIRRTGNKVSIGSVLDKSRPTGPMDRRFYVPFKNYTGLEIPGYSFIRMDDVDATSQCIIGRKPNAHSMSASRLLITGPGKIPIDDTGLGYYAESGGNWVDINGALPSVDDSFGTVNGQFYGEKDKEGFKVNGVFGGNALIAPFKAYRHFKLADAKKIRDTSPDTTFAWNNYFERSFNPTFEEKAIFKFTTPRYPDGVTEFLHCIGENSWATCYAQDAAGAVISTCGVGLRLFAEYITADFDLNAATWNNQPTTAGLENVGNLRWEADAVYTNWVGGVVKVKNSGGNQSHHNTYFSWSPNVLPETVYGIVLSLYEEYYDADLYNVKMYLENLRSILAANSY